MRCVCRCLFSTALVLLFGCQEDSDSLAEDRKIEARVSDSYAIFSLILNDKDYQTGYGGVEVKNLVVHQEFWTMGKVENQSAISGFLKGYGFIMGDLPELQSDTYEDFKEVFFRGGVLESHFESVLPVQLISQKRVNDFGSDNGSFWTEFYREYPNSGGLHSFSRVGFSRDRSQALVYHGILGGELGGFGVLIVLNKEGDTWAIVKDATLWVA